MSEVQAAQAPRQRWPMILGWTLLAIWVAWWTANFIHGRMILADRIVIPAFANGIGLDFMHNYKAARFWISGDGNPYLSDFGDPRDKYGYPPAVLPLFAWCYFVPLRLAADVWAIFIASIVMFAVWIGQRSRPTGVSKPPLVLPVAAALWSTAVAYAMERGNCDVLVLLFIIAAIALLKRHTALADAGAGTVLAWAAWLKIYPLVVVAGLLGLKRNRALAFAAIAFILIGTIPLRYTKQWLNNARHAQAIRLRAMNDVVTWQASTQPMPTTNVNDITSPLDYTSHSLSSYWPELWESAGVRPLARIPGVVAAGLFLFPLAAWVSWRLFQSPARETFGYAYLLWLAALATFWMPDSNDYNLIYLPVAALTIWSSRASPFVHFALGAMFFLFQPLNLGLSMQLLFAVKILALGAVAVAIVQATRATSAQIPA